jgi:hypothetical protein
MICDYCIKDCKGKQKRFENNKTGCKDFDFEFKQIKLDENVQYHPIAKREKKWNISYVFF